MLPGQGTAVQQAAVDRPGKGSGFGRAGRGATSKGMPGTVPDNCPDGPHRAPADLRRLQKRPFARAGQSSSRCSHALHDGINRPHVLEEAWQAVRADRGAAGVDHETIAAVEAYGPATTLSELAEVLRSGSSKPAPVRRARIRHSDGKRRPLGFSRLKDRVAQQAATIVLGPIREATSSPARMGSVPSGRRPRRWGRAGSASSRPFGSPSGPTTRTSSALAAGGTGRAGRRARLGHGCSSPIACGAEQVCWQTGRTSQESEQAKRLATEMRSSSISGCTRTRPRWSRSGAARTASTSSGVTSVPACRVRSGSRSGSPATTCTAGRPSGREARPSQAQRPHWSKPARSEGGVRGHRTAQPLPPGRGNCFPHRRRGRRRSPGRKPA
jgi:hypothetical protein